MLLLRLRKILYAIRRRGIGWPLLRHHVLAASEHSSVLCFGYDVVVDIGANKGQFALAARAICPAARIVCFEPLVGPFQTLKSVFAHDTKTSMINAAVGEFVEIRRINVSAKDDSSSLLPISNIQVKIFPGTNPIDTTDVKVAPLGALMDLAIIRDKSLLKIDVQGFELSVLRGIGIELKRFTRIYCECSFVELYTGQALFQDVADYLGIFGFTGLGVFNATYRKPNNQCVQADFLFSRSREDASND